MNLQSIVSATAKVEAATQAVITAQTIGAAVAASGPDKMSAALSMAGMLSPALPPHAAATVTLLQAVYNMFTQLRHPAFVKPADQANAA